MVINRTVGLVAALILLAGCHTWPAYKLSEKERLALEICGSIKDLQLKNITTLESANALVFDQKFERSVQYADLTPSLRVSAMRSHSHCMGFHMGTLSPERYERLMASESTLAEMAERSLTPEQLQAAQKKGYTRVDEILGKANVTEKSIAELRASISKMSLAGVVNSYNLNEIVNVGLSDPEITKTLGQIIDRLEAVEAGARANSQVLKKELTANKDAVANLPDTLTRLLEQVIGGATVMTLNFDPKASELTKSHIDDLERVLRAKVTAKSRIVVIGSADNTGTPQGNAIYSYKRALAVGEWIRSNLPVAPDNVYIGAVGATTKLVPSGRNRNVTVQAF